MSKEREKGCKERGVYISGGWCHLRSRCGNDGKMCNQCFNEIEFKERRRRRVV